MNQYHYIFGEASISTGTKKPKKKPKKISKKGGTSGRSPHSSSENKRRRVADGDIEIVKNSPLDELAHEIKKPIEKIGVVIEPETVRHAKRLTYKFGPIEVYDLKDQKSADQLEREEELYNKIVKHLIDDREENEFNDQRWCWPQLYLDREKTLKAHFTIQMSEGGRFIIPTRRDMNLLEFFREFILVFRQFLSKEEIEALLGYFQLDTGKGEFLHLANRIGPDETVEEKLNKARLKIEIVDLLGRWDAKVYIDKSFQEFEVESEAWTPENENLNEFLTKPFVATGTLRKIAYNSESQNRWLSHLCAGQTALYRLNERHHGEVMGSVKNVDHQLVGLDYRCTDILGELTKMDISHEIYFTTIDRRIRQSFQKAIPILQGINDTGQLINRNIVDVSNLIYNLQDFTDQGFQDVKDTIHSEVDPLYDEFTNLTQVVSKGVEDTKQIVSSGFTDANKVFNDKFDTTHQILHENTNKIIEKIEETKDELKRDIKEVITSEFSQLRSDFRNNLSLVLRALHKVPSLTSRELYNALKDQLGVSQSSLYRYLNKLHDKGLVKVQKEKNCNRPGRPSKLYRVSSKITGLLKKLSKSF